MGAPTVGPVPWAQAGRVGHPTGAVERSPMLPNFLIIGAMKGGTTSLYHYLRPHPEVFMPVTKELHFFVAEKNLLLGPGWYERRFRGAGDAIAVGEASTDYTKYPLYQGVPERIA